MVNRVTHLDFSTYCTNSIIISNELCIMCMVVFVCTLYFFIISRSCGLGSYIMSQMNTGGCWEAASMQTWNLVELNSGLSEAPWYTRL